MSDEQIHALCVLMVAGSGRQTPLTMTTAEKMLRTIIAAPNSPFETPAAEEVVGMVYRLRSLVREASRAGAGLEAFERAEAAEEKLIAAIRSLARGDKK